MLWLQRKRLRSSDAETRLRAIAALQSSKYRCKETVLDLLLPLLRDPDRKVRKASTAAVRCVVRHATRGLEQVARSKSPNVVLFLAVIASDPESAVDRSSAIKHLIKRGCTKQLVQLLTLEIDRDTREKSLRSQSSRDMQNEFLNALGALGWSPGNANERVIAALARQDYGAAAAEGACALPRLLREFVRSGRESSFRDESDRIDSETKIAVSLATMNNPEGIRAIGKRVNGRASAERLLKTLSHVSAPRLLPLVRETLDAAARRLEYFGVRRGVSRPDQSERQALSYPSIYFSILIKNATTDPATLDDLRATVDSVLSDEEIVIVLQWGIRSARDAEDQAKAASILGPILGVDWFVCNNLLKQFSSDSEGSNVIFDRAMDNIRRWGWADAVKSQLVDSLPSPKALEALTQLGWEPQDPMDIILVAITNKDQDAIAARGRDAIPAFCRILAESNSQDYRDLAISNLGRLQEPSGVAALKSILEPSFPRGCSLAVIKALLQIPGEEATGVLAKYATWRSYSLHKDQEALLLKHVAIQGLMARGPESVELLCARTPDLDEIHALSACSVPDECIDRVVRSLMSGVERYDIKHTYQQRPKTGYRDSPEEAVCKALIRFGSAAARSLRDGPFSRHTANLAAEALTKIDDDCAVEALVQRLTHPATREWTCYHLCKNTSGAQILYDTIRSHTHDGDLYQLGVEALQKLGRKAMVESLEAHPQAILRAKKEQRELEERRRANACGRCGAQLHCGSEYIVYCPVCDPEKANQRVLD